MGKRDVCSVPYCRTSRSANVSLFKYPEKTSNLWKKWKRELEKNYKQINFAKISTGKICYLHFEDKFIRLFSQRRNLVDDAVPTRFFEHPDEIKVEHRLEKPENNARENYENNCRLCLAELESNRARILEDSIKQEVELLISSSLKTSASFPNKLCRICFKNVNKFMKFRTTILKNQEILSKALDQFEVEVKQEFGSSSYKTEDSANCIVIFPSFEEAAKDKSEFHTEIKLESYEVTLQNSSGENVSRSSSPDMNQDVHNSRADNDSSESELDAVPVVEEVLKKKRIKKRGSCQYCGKIFVLCSLKKHIASRHFRDQCSYECDNCK